MKHLGQESADRYGKSFDQDSSRNDLYEQYYGRESGAMTPNNIMENTYYLNPGPRDN